MNMTYKILWIDDSEDFIETAEELVKSTVTNNNMSPDVKIYSFFDKYRESEIDSFDIDIFNMYDLILIDYALSGTTGDKIIRDLRGRNIYTDIVFYSSNFETMQTDLISSGEPLDGVFYSAREDLMSTIDKVIKKNLKREYSIANIRGLLMDSSSEFDYICRTTTIELFEKLPIEKQAEIVAKAKCYVGQAETNSKTNFEKLNKANDIQFLKKAMESVEYVMNNKDRYAIMSMVVREFSKKPEFDDEFSEKYQAQIIKPRNDLAHNKLFYGKCKKKLHIAKKKQDLECDFDCENCKSSYSIEKCEELRRLIFDYYNLFNSLT